jgi:hypothetical protein
MRIEEEDNSLTPAVCSAVSSLSSLLTLFVVEAGTSCRSSVVALDGCRTQSMRWLLW